MLQLDVHQLSVPEVAAQLSSNAVQGLSEHEAKRRLAQYGPNELPKPKRRSFFRVFLEQFRDFMVLVLLGATAVSLVLGEVGDAVTIILIVIVNAVLGSLQEFRAERSLEALKEMSAPTARVRRDGEEVRIPAADVVPGDVLLLEAGDKPAADARLLQATELGVEEAILTGESVPVTKSAEWVGRGREPISERKNMVFAGTTIIRGRAVGLVTQTGTNTAMGGIARLLTEQAAEATPLQQRLEGLGKTLVWACLGIAAVVVVAGVLRGESLFHMFLAGVSLAVAAIPEGLPAIVTIALAVGVQRMLRRHALVRHLPAVETLGSATVIASDKAGHSVYISRSKPSVGPRAAASVVR
ncbi:MAG: HAD-IC family P-type ATPase [Thermaerobacter sp.]|nr:HAD-IC family P-type ATPase [Thermaerobacter sp.]